MSTDVQDSDDHYNDGNANHEEVYISDNDNKAPQDHFFFGFAIDVLGGGGLALRNFRWYCLYLLWQSP